MVPICGQPWRTFENWPTIPSSKRSCTKSRCSGKRWRSRNHFKRIDGRLRSIPVGYRPTEQLIQRHQPCGDFLCLADRQLLTEEIGRATSELQSLMRTSYHVFCLKKKNKTTS